MNNRTIISALFVCFGVVLTACNESSSPRQSNQSSELTEIRLQRLARTEVEKVVRDPESAQFRNQIGQCGEVNSKNGFGAYTGFQRFVAGSGIVVFEREVGSAQEFVMIWNQFCN